LLGRFPGAGENDFERAYLRGGAQAGIARSWRGENDGFGLKGSHEDK
jgi:hypothetical protein